MIKWNAGLSLILAVFWMSLQSVANISFYHYGSENGLPNPKIISISQDSAGFIWLAGENNIYRFDGSRFKTYSNTTNGNSQQPFEKILSLYTDSRGTLWVGTSSGLAIFNHSCDQFRQLEEGWNREDINDIKEDSHGIIWLATDKGIVKLDPETKNTIWYTGSSIIKTPGNNVLPVNVINKIACQDDTGIWFSNNEGRLFFFDPQSLAFTDHSIIGDIDLISSGIRHINFYNNTLFIGTITHGLVRFNQDEGSIRQETFTNTGNVIHHFKISNDSIAWLAGDNGLFRYNYQTGSFKRYTEDPADPMSMFRSAISFVYEDREKNLWLSTGIKGVDYGLTNSPFHNLSRIGHEANQLSNLEVTAIEFDRNNNMWLGYEQGILEKHSAAAFGKKIFYPESASSSGKPGAIFKILTDSKNRTWFGGWGSGLQKLNQNDMKFRLARIRPYALGEKLKSADIRGITEDIYGNLWICFHGYGFGCYEPETQKLKLIRHDPKNPENSLSNDWTLNLSFDTEGYLWIATAHGVSKYNPEQNSFENYYHDENNPKTLNSNKINTIYCDPSGMVWAGTEKGINVYLPGINNFIPITGTPGNTFHNISDIRGTQPGEIWASTQFGMLKLTWKTDMLQENIEVTSQYHNHKTGLLSAIYFHRSSAADNDGNIYFGGNEGIDVVDPEKAARFQIHTPEPIITEINLDGLPVYQNINASEPQTLNLTHLNKSINIRFAAPAFNNSTGPEFRYMMEGFEEQWNYTQSEQVATYTNLPPGKFRFLVEVEDASGNWNQKAAFLSLTVVPPFWKTLPFYIIIAAVLLAIFFLVSYTRSRIFLHRQKQLENIIETRTRELKNKNAELEKINQTQTKLFSIISHDLRSPFAGILGVLELLADKDSVLEEERKKELLVMAKNSAENTFELLENLLTWAHSQMKNNESKLAKHNLGLLLKKNVELRTASAQQKDIEILNSFPDNLYATFDLEMVNTIIRNLLNNAVKFTPPGGKIEVSAKRKNGEVKVSIADTGIGIEEENAENLFHLGNSNSNGTMGEKGTGLGLIICKEFIENNNGSIGFIPNDPKGTVFYFSLPVNQ